MDFWISRLTQNTPGPEAVKSILFNNPYSDMRLTNVFELKHLRKVIQVFNDFWRNGT